MTSTEQQPINKQIITTLAQAFHVLGIVGGISKQSEINAAFRMKAKATHERGNYTADMDALTQAKDMLTEALRKVIEQAQRDQGRAMARQQEQEERERAKARPPQSQQPPKEEKPTQQQPGPALEPLRLGPGSPAHLALRAYELQQAKRREQARRVWMWHVSQREQASQRQQRQNQYKQRGGEIAMQQQPTPERRDHQTLQQQEQVAGDTIQAALQLYRQRQAELQQTRQRERELQQALSREREQRQKLETTVQTASALADQLRAILDLETPMATTHEETR